MGKVERQSTPARNLLTVLAMVALAVVSGGAVAAADQGDTIRVSVDSTGVEGDNRSRDSVITDDGRQVVFRSIASNLVPGDNTLDTGIASNEFFFADPADRFVSGDWGIVDGTDTPGLFRPGNTTFYFRHSNSQGNADSQLQWGEPGWLPVAGVFGMN